VAEIEKCDELQDDSAQMKINFALEQIKLSLKPVMARRYSSSLLASAVLWQKTSPALYHQLRSEDYLCLPSESHIKRLSQALNAENGLTNETKKYLNMRSAKLNEREKCVVLIMDEIHTNQKIEYTNGTFFGLEEGKIVKTMLGFMISSVGGPYSDMVALCQMSKLDSSILKQNYIKVLKTLTECGFVVVANSADNHAINIKFYTHELCDGTLLPFVQHPFLNGEKIFLLFDPVHIFKNIYNNFVNRKIFDCPEFDGETIGQAEFSHIEELFHIECGKPIRMAFKLSEKVLHPTNIEKTNVRLADALFHDSTIAALEFYASTQQEKWWSTVKFLKLIRKWWNIVNVKSGTKGFHKRNESMLAVTKNVQQNLNFLKTFSEWLTNWNAHSNKSLTRQTFQAAKQTSSVLPLAANYLLNEKKFIYVLLGLFQSDPIEKHFGWYRQLCGANYYVSVRQILEAEKTIRLRSLIKFSSYSFDEIKDGMAATSDQLKVDEDCSDFLDFLDSVSFSVPSISLTDIGDTNILFYISGYIARSLRRMTKCQSCTEIIVSDHNSPKVHFEDKDFLTQNNVIKKETFLEQINRGGLVKPTDLMYIAVVHIWNFYQAVTQNVDVKNKLFSCSNSKKTFSYFVKDNFLSLEHTKSIASQQCKSGHSFGNHIETIAMKVFNVCSVNFINDFNNAIRESRKRTSAPSNSVSSRKIAKLQSMK